VKCVEEKETGRGRCEFDKQMRRRVEWKVGCVRFVRGGPEEPLFNVLQRKNRPVPMFALL
jgi:hypothetical protein